METVLRGLAVYFVLFLIVRLSGRRTLGQMTPFDLILILMVSETTQQAMVGEDLSLTNAAILIITLFSIDIALSFIKRHWQSLDHVIDGVPTLLVIDGIPDSHALRKSRIDMKDLAEAARRQGIESLSDVCYAVLEVSGHISIIQRTPSRPHQANNS